MIRVPPLKTFSEWRSHIVTAHLGWIGDVKTVDGEYGMQNAHEWFHETEALVFPHNHNTEYVELEWKWDV